MRYGALPVVFLICLSPAVTRAGPLDLPTRPTTKLSARDVGLPRSIPATTQAVVIPIAQAFPTWGVTVTPPAGWIRANEPDLTTMARWVPGDHSPGAITIVVTPALDRTARGVATKTAQLVGGTETETTLGLRSAWQVTGGRGGDAAIYATRDKYIYEIRYQRPPPATPNPAELEGVRTSWQWGDVDLPSKHPEMRSDPIMISDQMTILLPNHMRVWAAPPPPPGTLSFGAVDITAQRIKRDFQFDLSMPTVMQGQSIDAIIKSVDSPLRAHAGVTSDTSWRQLDGTKDRVMSQIIYPPVPEEAKDQNPKSGACLGIVALDDQRRVLLNFTVNSEDPDVRFAFFAMAEKIIASVQPIGGPAAATTAPATPAPTAPVSSQPALPQPVPVPPPSR